MGLEVLELSQIPQNHISVYHEVNDSNQNVESKEDCSDILCLTNIVLEMRERTKDRSIGFSSQVKQVECILAEDRESRKREQKCYSTAAQLPRDVLYRGFIRLDVGIGRLNMSKSKKPVCEESSEE